MILGTGSAHPYRWAQLKMVRKFAPCANLMSLTKVIVGKRTNLKNKLCAGLEAHANDTLSPPLVNNTNSENGFVLFFCRRLLWHHR